MATEPLRDSLTTLLHSWRQGSSTAFGTLIDQVYDQLRAIAAKRLCRSGGFATLSPTELIHEALLGVMASPREFENRVHFFAWGASAGPGGWRGGLRGARAGPGGWRAGLRGTRAGPGGW